MPQVPKVGMTLGEEPLALRSEAAFASVASLFFTRRARLVGSRGTQTEHRMQQIEKGRF